MMAPNPHWWAQKPEVYAYRSSSWWAFMLVNMVYGVNIIVGPSLWPRAYQDPIKFILILCFLIALILTKAWEDRGGQRLETRFNHITLFKNDDVKAHEDMRDILSLEPVYGKRNGKLKYHLATFPTGNSIRIYHNLSRHDELIAKLKSYLARDSQ